MWKSKFRRRAPSTRCCPRNYICPISTPSTRCCPQNGVCSMARVEVHAGLAAIAYPNSLVDFHAATDAWSRVCWPLGMTTILPVTRVTGRASSRPAIVRSRSGLRERRGLSELREGREGSRSARRQAWLGPPGRGYRSASNANLSRRSRPRRAVVTATACAGFRRHRGVHTKVGITFLLSLWAGAEHRSWPRGGFLLNPRRSRLPGIPAEAGAVGAVSRGERACSLPVTRTRGSRSTRLPSA